ncbi:MAG: uroporphyrinogen-III synthase [Gammaproteobacteria bacterium]|nr:uroporphyrinogen-III synthase [Gammaproteobacteria bacterium]
MLIKRGATVVRCPLVAIYDSPETDAIYHWLEECIQKPYDDLILLTGEGLRRLLGFARRGNLLEAFINSLGNTCLISRGPKPGQALKQVGLKPDIVAEIPTTDGIIATLERMNLESCRVAVQLYGDDPNSKLVEYLKNRKADVVTVAPYRYAADSDDKKVEELINELLSGSIDAITFTSQPQLKRLLDVANKLGQKENLDKAISQTVIAAVGPVVADAIRIAGWQIDVMPEDSFFMKPMVTELTARFTDRR